MDDLTAKKLEVEANLKSMTEKATKLAEELQEAKANLENQLEKQAIAQPPPISSAGNQIIYSVINDFMPSSKCASLKEREYLHIKLRKKRFLTILLFCGSMHGWTAKDFHSRCDGKGPLISLFKIKDGDCIGGYSKA